MDPMSFLHEPVLWCCFPLKVITSSIPESSLTRPVLGRSPHPGAGWGKAGGFVCDVSVADTQEEFAEWRREWPRLSLLEAHGQLQEGDLRLGVCVPAGGTPLLGSGVGMRHMPGDQGSLLGRVQCQLCPVGLLSIAAGGGIIAAT